MFLFFFRYFTLCDKISVPNVYGVVYTKANREDYADAGDDVNGGVPVVEEAHHVSECHGHHHYHSQTYSHIAQQKEGSASEELFV